jgi:hypothetical protein
MPLITDAAQASAKCRFGKNLTAEIRDLQRFPGGYSSVTMNEDIQ